MITEPIRVGVMGCASIAARMVIPAIQASSRLKLTWVASRTEEKARQFGDKFSCPWTVGYDSLLEKEDVDMVYMPLPTALHPEWGMKTLDAGKHLLLEKSLAPTLADARRLIARAREKKCALQENFMFAYHRQMAEIRSVLESGKLGEIRCIRSSFGFPPFPDAGNIRYSSGLGGGALLDAGAYTLKVASLLLGPSLQVGAAHLTMDLTRGVDLQGGIFLHDKAGTIVETAFGFNHFYQCSLEIWGSGGRLTADRIFTAGPGVVPVVRVELPGETQTLSIGSDNHFLNLLEDMATKIGKGDFEAAYQEIDLQASLLETTRKKATLTLR